MAEKTINKNGFLGRFAPGIGAKRPGLFLGLL
jgi:hypothetical protein